MNSKSSSQKQKLRCHVCGKRFKKGQTRYRINIEVISDFNGYIEDFSKKPQDYLEKKIQKIMKETKEMTEKELEEEVYLKRHGLVCVNCREEFLKLLGKFMGR
jgi:pyruvate/oxaloacetate carboxyltransferase